MRAFGDLALDVQVALSLRGLRGSDAYTYIYIYIYIYTHTFSTEARREEGE